MATLTLKQLFAKKASSIKQALGSPTSDVHFVDDNDRFEQQFEHGIIVSKSRAPRSVSSLIYLHGRLYQAAWSSGASWLGKPRKDPYETKNREGNAIEVQHFEEGVIWCRVDGEAEVSWLSWHDWEAVGK